MVAIRLSRTGAKKKPSYRVVVIDKRRARDSRNIEIVGHYNPRPDPIEVVLKRDRIDYWVGVGAQMSDTVKRLVRVFDERVPAEESEQPAAAPVAEVGIAPEPPVQEAAPGQPGEPVPAEPGEESDDDLDVEALAAKAEQESTANADAPEAAGTTGSPEEAGGTEPPEATASTDVPEAAESTESPDAAGTTEPPGDADGTEAPEAAASAETPEGTDGTGAPEADASNDEEAKSE